jgi:hypothetical protein
MASDVLQGAQLFDDHLYTTSKWFASLKTMKCARNNDLNCFKSLKRNIDGNFTVAKMVDAPGKINNISCRTLW